MKIIVVDGISLKFEDDTAGSLVEKVCNDLRQRAVTAEDGAKKLTTDLKAAVDELTALKKTVAETATAHDAKIVELTAKIPTAAQIEELANTRATVVMDALVLIPKFEAKGKTVPAIRAEVLTAVMAADAEDKALKAIAVGVLDGVDLTKPEAEGPAAAAFKAVVAAKRTTTVADGESKEKDLERRTGRALSGGGSGSAGAVRSNTHDAQDDDVEVLDGDAYADRMVAWDEGAAQRNAKDNVERLG